MNYQITLQREQQLRALIEAKATETPEQLALKLNTSVRTVHRMIKAHRNMGEPIAYSKIKQTYYYK